MTGAALLSLALLALAGASVCVASLLGHRSPIGFLLSAYVVAWALLVAIVTVLSLPSRLGRLSLTAGLVLSCASGLALWQRAGRPRPGCLRRGAGDAVVALRQPAVGVLAVALALALAYVGALTLGTPPNDWDGLTYHVPRAALWHQQGALGYVEAGNESRLNANPPVAEVGTLLALTTSRTDRFLALPAFGALLAALVAVAGIARRIGLTHPEALFAGLVFTSLPVVLLHGQAILNDLVVAAFLLTALYFLLGDRRADGAVAALALGLAAGTKFTALLLLPVLVLVALVAAPRRRLPTTLGVVGLGLVLASPWYLLNLSRTGELDGGLAESTGQLTDRSLVKVVSSFRALAVDVIDASGLGPGSDVVFTLVGSAIALGCFLVAARRDDRRLFVTGAAVWVLLVVTPRSLLLVDDPLMRAYQRSWLALGREDLAFAEPTNWNTSVRADTARSGYGALGTLVLLAGVGLAAVGVRRRRLPGVTVVLAAAPFLAMAILAATIVWDPWRQRLLMFPVGLATVVWGAALRARALAWLTVGLAVATLPLVLADPLTKPSGLRDVHGPRPSVWGLPWVDALTILRPGATPAVLGAVARTVPQDARLAVAAPEDAYLSPFFGRGFSRHIALVPNGGRLPSDAGWAVTMRGAHPLLCEGAWRVREADARGGWRVLERTGPDHCGSSGS